MPRNQVEPFEVGRAQICYDVLWLEIVNVVFGANLNLLGFTSWDTAVNEICEIDTTSVARIVYFGHKIYPWNNSVIFTLGLEGVAAAMCTYKSATSEPSSGPPGHNSIPFNALHPGVVRLKLQFHSRAIDSTSAKNVLINQLKDHSGEFRLLPPEYMAMVHPLASMTTTLDVDIRTRLVAKRNEIVAKTERNRLQIESMMRQVRQDTQEVMEFDSILADLND
ncbi:hypothetical protein MMC07_008123 [Pseudocyphellaria aurata]|nr:hypothetical protein [Pseudocyphellaria aurata]